MAYVKTLIELECPGKNLLPEHHLENLTEEMICPLDAFLFKGFGERIHHRVKPQADNTFRLMGTFFQDIQITHTAPLFSLLFCHLVTSILPAYAGPRFIDSAGAIVLQIPARIMYPYPGSPPALFHGDSFMEGEPLDKIVILGFPEYKKEITTTIVTAVTADAPAEFRHRFIPLSPHRF